MPEGKIRAEYVVRLSTPIYMGLDLESHVPSIKFDRPDFAIEINRWGFTIHEPFPDGGFEPGELSAISVKITGLDPVDLTSGTLPSGIHQKYEEVLVSSVAEFVNWVRIRTQQPHLNNRFPVREYDVVFFSEEGIISQQETVNNLRRGDFSLIPDDFMIPGGFVGLLSLDEWQTIGESLHQGGPPLSADLLIYESKALRDAGFNGPALIIAVTALEYYCLHEIPEDKRFHYRCGEKKIKGTKELFNTLVGMISDDARSRIDDKRIRRIIELRNRITHGHRKESEVTRSDINDVAHTIRVIQRERYRQSIR